jgi:transcriptional regulator with XRE-family HTH domain
MNNLGKTIRIIRQAKSITMADFARNSGVSVPYVSLVEGGKRQPSLDVLRRFAAALEIPPEALVLMALGRETELKSNDSIATTLADTVSNLIEMETRLSRLLDCEDGSDATASDNT